jgi:hypothetical protein
MSFARQVVGAIPALTAMLLAASPAAEASTACDPGRPAVAHRAGAVELDPQSAARPYPCMTFTGPTTDNAAVGVTASGTAFYGPIEQVPGVVPAPAKLATPSILTRSSDLGANWEPVVPGIAGLPSPHGSLTTWLSVDERTSRVWYATPAAPCGATVSWSDDEGESWQHNLNVGCPAQGANRLMEGPPPPAGERPSGYSNVVYYCANAVDEEQSVLFCHKSLDGGRSFRWVGGFPDAVPPDPDCGAVLRHTRAGEIGPDGILYFPKDVCGRGSELALAVSDDEGKTWTTRPVRKTAIQDLYVPALAVDADNDLYLAWKGAGGKPYLIVSRDRGSTWSEPLMVAPPGVQEVVRLSIAARESGHVSISYLGTTDGGTSFNGYITETRDGLDDDPTFFSASVNDPATPLRLAKNAETYANRIQSLRGQIAADGTPWAAFHCARTSLCPDGRVGIAARLERPR